FHTNVKTKALIVSCLIGTVRDGAYVERDPEACNEMVNYRQLPNGSFAAAGRHHDDILMTRAIGLFVLADTTPPAPITHIPFCPD
ncbi:MAG: terminase, partial [Veillonella sp.]|nr:terminase [Veillonella sp.]